MTEATLFEIGELVGGTYEIRSVLGEGGMGRVYGAHDIVLNRRVAVKASWPSVDAKLLQKEAQAIASVRHPGMIDVYGAGTHRDIPYLVMEFLYGVNLASFLDKRRDDDDLDVVEILDLVIPVADALAAVHRSGIAHRDVKPANIMLTPNGRIVLMDFGLFQPESDDQSKMSGTPEYMAPESLLGQVEPRNAFFVDIYALGITMYELLAGDVPFLGDTAMETVRKHIKELVPNILDERPDLPPRLAALLREMLAKDPHERPPSMEAVAFRLRAVRDAQNAAQVAEAPRAKFTVLVVDDDTALAKLVGMYVTRAVPDAQVVAVGDAERALASVRERPPDVMLMDLHMPRMNGIELCMMLRGMHLADQCTIVAVSAGASHADIDLLRQLGITRFVPKGADLGALLTTQVKELHQAWQRSARASASTAPSAPPPSSSRMAAAAPAKAPVAREVPPAAREPPPLVSAVARESLTTAPDASRFLRLLARNLPGMLVLLFDRDLRVLLADGGAAAAFGLDREAAKGRTVFDVTGADRAPELQGLYQGAMRGESGEASFERNGRRFVVHAAAVRDEGGALVCGMATIREASRN